MALALSFPERWGFVLAGTIFGICHCTGLRMRQTMDFRNQTDYRAQAKRCLEFAEGADDRGSKLHWLCLAEGWLLLAEGLTSKTFKGGLGIPFDFPSPRPTATRH